MHVGIENVHYETRSQSSTTNGNGEFRYHPGETLTFRVGDLVLAENVPAAPFLSPETLTVAASDDSVQEVSIKRTGSSDLSLEALEAQVVGKDWHLESTDWQTGTVRFYHDGPSTEPGTVRVNVKVDYPDFDNYRWFRKTLRGHVN